MDVLGEASAALVALEGLLSQVQAHVRLEVGGGAEPLPALVTPVRLFT